VTTAQETGGGRVAAEPARWRPVLLERDGELAAVDTLIGGSGRLLAIEGPPGIGKTSLITETRRRVEATGMLVFGARGSEFEKTFSFGLVRQLFEPYLVQLSEEERAEVLAGAAELAIPLFEPAQLSEASADVSLGMLHGLYWLTANVAAKQPLLLVIDDLHWSDLASLRWLAYLLPRVEDLEVLIVAGLRQAEPGEDPALLAQIMADPLTTVARPAPLSKGAATLLARETLAEDAEDAFGEACHEITGGNPLLLHELLNALVAEDVAPVGASVPALRELAARAGWRAVSVRLSRLPPEATKLAQAVSILGDDVDPHHAAALAGLSEEKTATAAADLARVDVLRPQPPLGFVHPLIRGAVYETLTALERSSLHARASHLLAESGTDPERVAAHLLLVPPAFEPSDAAGEVVAVLRDAARSARCRGASESAVAYLRRAHAEPFPGPERAELLLELGLAEALVDGQAAAEHLGEAHRLIEDPVRRAETAVLLGHQLFYLHRLDESNAVFSRALDELAGADPELERLLEAGLISNGIFHPPLDTRVAQRLAQVRDRGGDTTLGEKMLLGLLAFHDSRAGTPAAVAVPLARRALAEDTLLRAESGGGALIRAGMVLAMADEDEALALYDAALAQAHLSGSIVAFASAKFFRAQALLFRGDLAEAEAEAGEAFTACREWGFHLLDAFVYIQADALMEQGKVDDAAEVLTEAGWGEATPEDAPAYTFRNSRGRLLMLGGDLEGGLEELLDAGRGFDRIDGRNPAFMAWRSQAALALLQLGRTEEARPLVEEELELARAWGAPRALGAALRAAGLVAGGKEGLALLQEAVEVLADSPAKLEQAKARTELGAALRRANHRARARDQLRRAVELATICGASPLAARAESELLATGARPRRIALSGLESLTPSERRVAEMAADGPTNREIAQALFVTPKTVEVHLSSVYRKLGISSRSQLAGALAEPARAKSRAPA
jgi:DNA-binding CsgD family transcriptional regulator/tetratricopeptide (TPR) repeat protein